MELIVGGVIDGSAIGILTWYLISLWLIGFEWSWARCWGLWLWLYLDTYGREEGSGTAILIDYEVIHVHQVSRRWMKKKSRCCNTFHSMIHPPIAIKVWAVSMVSQSGEVKL